MKTEKEIRKLREELKEDLKKADTWTEQQIREQIDFVNWILD